MPFSFDTLKSEYEELFESAVVRPERIQLVDQTLSKILSLKTVYQAIMLPTGIPWQFVGIIHSLEASLSLTKHLHNGDPLTGYTVQVPKGRPKVGHEPPFTFAESAVDALTMHNLDSLNSWTLPEMLYRLESYNGWGYRNKGVHTPYVWSFTNQYSKGKYVKDGVFSSSAVSQQCGGGALLKRMIEQGVLTIDDVPSVVSVFVAGKLVPVSAFVQKGNSWIAPKMLEGPIPGLKVVAFKADTTTLTCSFGGKVRDFPGRIYQDRGHVDASDLIRDFMGYRLDLDSQGLKITKA